MTLDLVLSRTGRRYGPPTGTLDGWGQIPRRRRAGQGTVEGVSTPPRIFSELHRAWAVAPTTSNGLSAMSPKRRAALLCGHDATTVLEAASTVLADIENDRFDVIAARLSVYDRRALHAWKRRVEAEGTKVAATPVHPLALLAATTLALGQSGAGPRTDAVREELASRLTEVGLRFNAAVLGGREADEAVLAYMSRSALWRAVDQEDWMIWSGELVHELASTPEAAAILTRFEAVTGLTVEEWWLRGLGERSTRRIHGARSWGGADIDRRIDDAWCRLVVAPLADAVEAAQNALSRDGHRRPPRVTDPFDLHWLASRPIVQTPDGRRFHLWLGAINRSLLPAAIAQTVADTIGERYDRVSFVLGRAAERRLTAALDHLPDVDGDDRIPESAMPGAISKCDYLVDHGDALLGIDFTLSTPTRSLASGTKDGVAAFIERVSDKFAQVYSSFQWRDPAGNKRWLPFVVFATPTVVDPLLNERVHEALVASGRAPAGSSEVMTAGVPEFLDLIEYARQSSRCIVELVREWRDGPQRGAMLDWWLADRDALRSSGKLRIGAVTDRAAAVLAAAEAD